MDPIVWHVLKTTADSGAKYKDTLSALNLAVAVQLQTMDWLCRKNRWLLQRIDLILNGD